MTLRKSLLYIIFLPIFSLSLSCSSSTKQIKSLRSGRSLRIDSHSLEGKKDSVIVLSFYEIVNQDTLRIKPLKFLNIDVLKQKIKISDLVWSYGFEGNIIIQLSLSPAEKAYNIRALTSNFGIEKSFEAALSEFKFININFQISNPDYISVLLIAYCKLREFRPGPPPPIHITK